MILVGLSGAIGSGKTTFAEYLASNEPKHAHFEGWELIAEIGNALLRKPLHEDTSAELTELNKWIEPLRELVREVTHCTLPVAARTINVQKLSQNPGQYAKLLEFQAALQINSDLQQGMITMANKEQYRSLLQWLGGYLAKNVKGDIWYKELVRRIKNTPGLELATVGGLRFPADAEVLRTSGGIVLTIQRPGMVTRDATEITERESSMISADATIINNGTLDQLKLLSITVQSDLRNNCLKLRYVSNASKL